MREIKFRAWDKEKREMILLEPNTSYSDFKNFELSQYTGLKDKNGKEIYEGDIFTDDDCSKKRFIFEYNGLNLTVREVGYRIGSLFITDDMIKLEVIGNIYENPELLEE